MDARPLLVILYVPDKPLIELGTPPQFSSKVALRALLPSKVSKPARASEARDPLPQKVNPVM
jgi:hypothetical protein